MHNLPEEGAGKLFQSLFYILFSRYRADHARKIGLTVFAGHGLTPENVVAIAAIPEIEELNIGHNLIAQSIYHGLENAINTMMIAIKQGVAQR